MDEDGANGTVAVCTKNSRSSRTTPTSRRAASSNEELVGAGRVTTQRELDGAVRRAATAVHHSRRLISTTSMRSNATYLCPVCGFDGLDEAACHSTGLVRSMSRKHLDKVALDAVMRALVEFQTHGTVKYVRCDVCGNLLT